MGVASIIIGTCEPVRPLPFAPGFVIVVTAPEPSTFTVKLVVGKVVFVPKYEPAPQVVLLPLSGDMLDCGL